MPKQGSTLRHSFPNELGHLGDTSGNPLCFVLGHHITG
jgi:hypothetical protein